MSKEIKDEKNRLLIDAVRKRPEVWDKSLENYKIAKKVEIWQEIAEETGLDGDEAKKKWKLLRDEMSKQVKKKPSGDKARKKWAYFDAMEFILPTLKDSEEYDNFCLFTLQFFLL